MTPTLWGPALARGFGLGAGLIVAIGPQNAFVLRQGLKRRHVASVVMTCALCDAALIALGTAGCGSLIARSPELTHGAAWGGALFLLFYGARSFRAAWSPDTLRIHSDGAGGSLKTTLLTTLGFSLLNPHVYLDTVVLVGGLAAQYAPAVRPSFALGAMLASWVWFISLGYGASRLAPLFQRPTAWRVLDVLIGAVMWTIAVSLIASAVRR